MKKQHYDAVIIGSGIGGMCAGALLAHGGYKTLVVEKLPLLGGRCSTMEYKGFKIGTGAVYISVDGPISQVFQEVGVAFDVRPIPPGQQRYRIGGKFYQSPPKGVIKFLISKVGDEGEMKRVMDALRRGLQWKEPSDTISTRDWLLQYTQNENILGIFQGIIASMLTINADELSAGEFIRYLKWADRIRNFGHPPMGFEKLMGTLAGVIREGGGDVWTLCRARQILVADGLAKGVRVQKEGNIIEVDAEVIISNAGPKNTVELTGKENFDKGYLTELKETLRPTPLVWLTFSSDRPLIDYAGPMFVTDARRVNAIFCPSMICPEVAPPGKHLFHSGGAPLNSLAPFKTVEEIEQNLQDLREILPGFDQYSEILLVQCFQGDWPVFGSWPGYQLSCKTSIENLYNIGDATLPPGSSGTAGCAESAQLVVEEIKRRRV